LLLLVIKTSRPPVPLLSTLSKAESSESTCVHFSQQKHVTKPSTWYSYNAIWREMTQQMLWCICILENNGKRKVSGLFLRTVLNSYFI